MAIKTLDIPTCLRLGTLNDDFILSRTSLSFELLVWVYLGSWSFHALRVLSVTGYIHWVLSLRVGFGFIVSFPSFGVNIGSHLCK